MRRLALVAACAALLGLVTPAADAADAADPLERYQWGLDVMDTAAAWEHATGAGAVVAVIDTGVSASNQEFAPDRFHPASASWWQCPAGAAVPCTDVGAWGRYGHGQLVASILGAGRNGVGMTGVAPDVEIMALRAVAGDLTDLEAIYAAVTDAIYYAVEHGADVINFSLGAAPHVWAPATAIPIAYLVGWGEAVAYALDHDVMVAVAAGNGFAPFCENTFLVEGADPLCVGATDFQDFHRWDSGWGHEVDLVAPGGGTETCKGIVAATSSGNQSSCSELPRGYTYFGQTSAATPHVAAVGALLAEQGIRGRAAQQRILETADDLGVPGADPLYGHGRVSALAAVTAVG